MLDRPESELHPTPQMDATYPAVRAFLDRHVLQYCADNDHGTTYDWIAFHLRCFENEWITKDMARAICRDLRDRGFLRFERGLFFDDGTTAGAGYRITDAGREYLETLTRSLP